MLDFGKIRLPAGCLSLTPGCVVYRVEQWCGTFRSVCIGLLWYWNQCGCCPSVVGSLWFSVGRNNKT